MIKPTLCARISYCLLLVAVAVNTGKSNGCEPPVQITNPSSLQAARQSVYLIDANDVLGVFIEGVLGKANEMPPVHFPEAGSNDLPSTGYPIVVRGSGTISLPLISPISVRGLSISQVESIVRKQYVESKILNERNRIMVSIMRKRTINVTVIRGDQSDSMSMQGFRGLGSQAVTRRSDLSQTVHHLQLQPGESDLLNAFSRSGGLPGVNAKPEVQVLRENGSQRMISNLNRSSNSPFPRTGGGTSFSNQPDAFYGGAQAGVPGNIDPRLSERDIVVVNAKSTETFFTGGLLKGGEYSIPRDRGLDVLEAISIAQGNPVNGIGPIQPLQPTELLLLRKQANYNGAVQQFTYRIDVNQAYRDPGLRMQVRAGDYLILQYSTVGRIGNVGIGTANTYGIRRLFGN